MYFKLFYLTKLILYKMTCNKGQNNLKTPIRSAKHAIFFVAVVCDRWMVSCGSQYFYSGANLFILNYLLNPTFLIIICWRHSSCKRFFHLEPISSFTSSIYCDNITQYLNLSTFCRLAFLTCEELLLPILDLFAFNNSHSTFLLIILQLKIWFHNVFCVLWNYYETYVSIIISLWNFLDLSVYGFWKNMFSITNLSVSINFQ